MTQLDSGIFTIFRLIEFWQKAPQPTNMDKNNFLSGLQSLLRYHQMTGIDSYPRNDDNEAFLCFQPKPATMAKTSVQAEKPGRGLVAGGRNNPLPEKSPFTLADIAAEVSACHACDLHEQRLYPVAGRGPEKVRLMLVGDWLAADEQGQLPQGQLFGVEQDLMLARMLAAIQLPVDSVFITNVIKCAVPGTCQPQASHVQSCVSFLSRQITILRPELICTMGMVAAKAVLGKSLPLSRLRGRLHEYEVSRDVRIPVITTYHPTYLLQNSEMKAATWADLQLLARELQ
jgi:uracil-DNA glycosylase